MNNKKMIFLGAALTGLMLAGCQSADKPVASTDAAMGECHGINTCKGSGDCGGAGYSCAGKNSCKGKGWMKMSKSDCMASNGEFKDN